MSTDDWCSPQVIAKGLRLLGGVHADPCTNARSIVAAIVRYFAGGLHLPWRPPRFRRRPVWTVYENPPYSKMGPWTDKGLTELTLAAAAPTELIRLVPVATSTAWWRRAMLEEPPEGLDLELVRRRVPAPLVIFTSRLPFIDEAGRESDVARFDSALLCYFRYNRRRRVAQALRAFESVISTVIDMQEHTPGRWRAP